MVDQRKEKNVKVTMNTILAGPDGVAKPGTVLDVPESVAKEWIDERFASPYDKERDKRAPVGLTKAPDKFGE